MPAPCYSVVVWEQLPGANIVRLLLPILFSGNDRAWHTAALCGGKASFRVHGYIPCYYRAVLLSTLGFGVASLAPLICLYMLYRCICKVLLLIHWWNVLFDQFTSYPTGSCPASSLAWEQGKVFIQIVIFGKGRRLHIGFFVCIY